MASEQVGYDSAIIEEAAHRLYRQATSAVRSSVALGLLVGAAASAGIAATMENANAVGIATLAGALIGALMGYVRGRERAFALKLQAQVALCQAQIERNTSTRKV